VSQRMNRKQWLSVALIAIIALFAGIGISHWLAKNRLSGDPSAQQFFQQEWVKPDGQTLNPAIWQNRLVLVNFWASWCPPCVAEMPALDQLSKDLTSKPVIFIGVGIDSPSNIREFLLKTPVSYPIVIGGLEGSQIGKSLGNSQGALPFTVIIDSKGQIIYRKLGKIDADELKSVILKAI